MADIGKQSNFITKASGREQICESLITWLKTFLPDIDFKTPADLSDGVVIGQALNIIAPDFFTQQWLANLKSVDDINNWISKVANLHYILHRLTHYNRKCIRKNLKSFPMPNIEEIARRSDPEELGHLLELVLNVAIHCENNQYFIHVIMSMEEGVQQIIKNSILKVISKQSCPADVSAEEIQAHINLAGSSSGTHKILERCQDLKELATRIQEDRKGLLVDGGSSEEKLQQDESLENISSSMDKKLAQLQQQIVGLEEELLNLEAEKDHVRVELELLNQRYTKLQGKVEIKQLQTIFDSFKEDVKNSLDNITQTSHNIQCKMYDSMVELESQLKLSQQKNKLEMMLMWDSFEACQQSIFEKTLAIKKDILKYLETMEGILPSIDIQAVKEVTALSPEDINTDLQEDIHTKNGAGRAGIFDMILLFLYLCALTAFVISVLMPYLYPPY